jgi:predicted ester cyclase
MANHVQTVTNAVGRLNQGDVDGYIDGLYHPHCRFHGFPSAFAPDRDGITEFFRALVAAVPDVRIAAEDVVVSDDEVAIRFTLTGTHSGGLMGAAGSGQALEVEGITILRFEGDRVAERWNRLDDLALLAQLGLVPATA